MKNQIEEVRNIVCAPKYLEAGESFKEGMVRIADHLKDNEKHFETCKDILLSQRFLPGGRIQASAGAARQTTAFNCFVSQPIQDSMSGIMSALTDAAQTLRLGGGDGFDFSTLRPKGSLIKTLGSTSSGPIMFMHMWDAMCDTIKSAGHRRGAMMGVLRVDHPDIEEFITCKQKPGFLTNFNISVAVTDEFMNAVQDDKEFDLVFDGVVYKTVKAKALWNKIMRNTWDHAEPGVLFIDRINAKNNLYYCEEIAATNPCGEQPLPPNGACLLGSFNLTKYVYIDEQELEPKFNYEQFIKDIGPIVRMMDNVVDRTIYPLKDQEIEAKNKRRMGLGITGTANAAEFLNMSYGSEEMLDWLRTVLILLRNECYQASICLAKEKGPFPLYRDKYIDGEFIQTLPLELITQLEENGIRNSHLLSIAPTGTISLWAGNISSGIEPVFSHHYLRKVIMPGNDLVREEFELMDYAYDQWGLMGLMSHEISAKQHIDVLCVASQLVDSACSKTCNVGDDVTFDEFKELYLMAYEGGASGCTTFRPSGFREGVLKKAEERDEQMIENKVVGPTCEIDPTTGEKSCAD